MNSSKLAIDGISKFVLGGAAAASFLGLAAIMLFLASEGLPAFSFINPVQFLTSTEWYPTEDPASYGIGALIIGTMSATLLTILISAPIGIASAIALHAGCSPTARRILKPAVELMASVPSVVLGFIGIAFIAPVMQNIFGVPSGLNLMNAALMLSFMSIPTIATISEDALRNVPQSLREASLALGASRWETLVKVELRWAMAGIGTALMLGISRTIGETMVVLMVAGGAGIIPESIFDPVRPMTSSIAAEMAEAAVGSDHFHALYATGLVLFLFTFAFNFLAWYITKKADIKR